MPRNTDIPAVNGAVPEVPSEVWDRLERVLDRFENAWNRGDRPALSDYLAAAATERQLLLIELIHEDLEYRIQTGEPARVEMYLKHYPELRDDSAVILDLIAAEYDYRREREPGDLRGEFRQRFPELGDALGQRLAPLSGAAPRRPKPLHPSATVAPHATLPEEPVAGFPHVPGYEILGVLGRGGMGVVYKARQTGLKRLVALKMVAAGILAEPQELARFRAEAEAAAALQHPNIVPIYEVAEHQGQPYFSMELIDGGSLAQAVGGKDSPHQVATLVETLARAIHYAHQHGIVHRDLKPANILLTFSREPPASADFALAGGSRLNECVPKITDFGLAKRLDSGTTGTQTGVILGTPSYMAPEQAAGRTRAIGQPTDVYALGAILYEMLIGRPPFQGETPLETVRQVRDEEVVPPRRLRPAVPRDLETICLKCLRKEPGHRYASALALADDLRRFLNGEPVLARPVGVWERGVKWVRRRPLAAMLVLVSLLAAGGLLVGTIQIEKARRQADREAAQARLQEQNAKANYERAEYSYRLARTSMESVLTEIRKDPRFQEGPLEGVRKLLLQAELKFYEQFAAQRGDEPAFKAERGEAYLNLVRITQELEGADKALTPCRQARALFSELARDDPANPDYQAKLAESHFRFGLNCNIAGRPREAAQALEDALAIMKPLAAKDPTRSRYQSQTADILITLGTVYNNTRRVRDAERTWSEVVILLTDLAGKEPANPDYRYRLAECHNNLATVYANTGRLPEAIRERQQALAIVQALAGQHPDDPRYSFYVGMFSGNLGMLYKTARRFPEAEQALRNGHATLKTLADRHPTVLKYARGLAFIRIFWGDLVQDTGKRADSLPWYTEAIVQLEAVFGKDPKDTSLRRVLGTAYQQRARVFCLLERHPEAIADWDRAIKLDTRGASSLRLYRAGSLACLGQYVRATAEVDAVTNGDKVSSGDLYNAGLTYAVAAAVVPDDSPLKERYAARAVAFFHRAVAKGFPEVDRLKKEPSLEGLRGREDFQQLLREVEERTKSPKNIPAGN